jgi:hypothetical protein
MPFIGSMPKDNGKNRATAIVAERPGIDPKIMPTKTPIAITNKHVGLNTERIPFIIITIILLQQYIYQNAGGKH